MKEESVEIVLTNEKGEQKTAKVLFYYHNDKRNKDYYFLFEEGHPDELFVKATSDGETFEECDEEEYDEAEQVLSAYNEDPKIASVK